MNEFNPAMGGRILLLALLLTWLQPAPNLITPGAAQIAISKHPIVAVHTRLTDEVEPWKIQRTLQMVRAMGATTIVEFFPWAYYQGEDGEIAWQHPDLVVEHAAAQGLNVVARISTSPDWARPIDTPINYLDEAAYADFAAFAAAFATRYQGKVQAIVVGNEPNLDYEWGFRQTVPADYVALLRQVYPAVKLANPGIQILAGALAPTLEPAESTKAINDLDYLAGIYQAGGGSYFDALAVHAYGLTFPPLAEPGAELLNFRRVELVREVMVAHGDAGKSIFITEFGWNDHPRWTLAVHPAQRIQYTLAGLQYAETNWPYVKSIAIWHFRLPAPAKNYLDYYSLVTPEFTAKPIYDELQKFATEEVGD